VVISIGADTFICDCNCVSTYGTATPVTQDAPLPGPTATATDVPDPLTLGCFSIYTHDDQSIPCPSTPQAYQTPVSSGPNYYQLGELPGIGELDYDVAYCTYIHKKNNLFTYSSATYAESIGGGSFSSCELDSSPYTSWTPTPAHLCSAIPADPEYCYIQNNGQFAYDGGPSVMDWSGGLKEVSSLTYYGYIQRQLYAQFCGDVLTPTPWPWPTRIVPTPFPTGLFNTATPTNTPTPTTACDWPVPAAITPTPEFDGESDPWTGTDISPFCGPSVSDDGGADKYISPACCPQCAGIFKYKVGTASRFHRLQFDWKFEGALTTGQTSIAIFASSWGEPDPDDWSGEWEFSRVFNNALNWSIDPVCDISGTYSPSTWYTIDIYMWQTNGADDGDNFWQVEVDGIPVATDCGEDCALDYFDYVDAIGIGLPWDVGPHTGAITHWIDNVRWWYDDDILFLPDEVSPCCE